MPEENAQPEATVGITEWKGAEIPRYKGGTFVQFYSNNMNLNFSTFDASLSFGEIVGIQNGKPLIEDRAKVTMSLQHLKAMLKVLNDNLAAFEKDFGEIQTFQLKHPAQ